MGLLFLACLLGGIAFVWSSILLLFKCNPRAVGCASGASFRPQGVVPSSQSEAVTDPNDSASSMPPDWGSIGDSSCLSSLPSEDENDLNANDVPTFRDDWSEDSVSRPSQRERRTQMVYILVGLVLIGCAPLLHFFFFLPFRESSLLANEQLTDVHDIVGEVEATYDSVFGSAKNAVEILDSLPVDEQVVCPDVDKHDIQTYLGFRLQDLIAVYQEEYGLVETDFEQAESEARTTTDLLGKGIDRLLDIIQTVSRYVWAIPGTLLGMCTLVSIAIFGTVVSWKQNSNKRLQRFLAYVILPLLLLVTLLSWILLMASGVLSAFLADFCLSGSPTGNPFVVIGQILEQHGIDADSRSGEAVSAYVSGCHDYDPIEDAAEIEGNLTGAVLSIWEHLAKIDTAGRQELYELCGEGNQVSEFLTQLRDLAKQLTMTARGLNSVRESMNCYRVSHLYDESINENLCGSLSEAACAAFVILFAMSVFCLILVSLRSSWYQVIDDDKIYDESEVAENMMVDEHEEYLAYISKYRHEWEEYGGIIDHFPISQTVPVESATESVMESSDLSSVNSDESGSSGSSNDKPAFNPYSADDSTFERRAEDISFESLKHDIDLQSVPSLSFPAEYDNTLPSPLPPPVKDTLEY